MARLYANEKFSRRAVETLRTLGHDVLTSFDSGKANQRISDADVLRFATSLGRAVLTLNRRDFIHLHNSGGKHAGIIVCTVDHDPTTLATRLNEALQQDSDVTGKLVRIVKSPLRRRQ